MRKTKYYFLTYFLLIAICLLINNIFKARWTDISIITIIRDYFITAILFLPTFLGGSFLIQYLNQKNVSTKSFSQNIIRNLALTLLISLVTLGCLYSIRFYIFKDNNLAKILESFTAIFLVNIILLQFIEFYFSFIKAKNEALKIEKEKIKYFNFNTKL